MTVPPVKSTPRLSPRHTRNNTASRKVAADTKEVTLAYFMKGMSRLILKNSMVRSLPLV
jgi:hypothetical protein